MEGINKARHRFFSSLIETWLGLPVRYTLLNLGRLDSHCEKVYDGYFLKHDFINPWSVKGCISLPKLRPDVNLRYLLAVGAKEKKRGRPQVRGGESGLPGQKRR